jgi:flagellum-specific ATP synthase
MTDYGIYPPISIQNSASRVMNEVIDEKHQKLAIKFKRLNSILKENEVLIRIGAYQKGNDKELDEAIIKKDIMEKFLGQSPNEAFSFNECIEKLEAILK